MILLLQGWDRLLNRFSCLLSHTLLPSPLSIFVFVSSDWAPSDCRAILYTTEHSLTSPSTSSPLNLQGWVKVFAFHWHSTFHLRSKYYSLNFLQIKVCRFFYTKQTIGFRSSWRNTFMRSHAEERIKGKDKYLSAEVPYSCKIERSHLSKIVTVALCKNGWLTLAMVDDKCYSSLKTHSSHRHFQPLSLSNIIPKFVYIYISSLGSSSIKTEISSWMTWLAGAGQPHRC